jgi:hypothetical protein
MKIIMKENKEFEKKNIVDCVYIKKRNFKNKKK